MAANDTPDIREFESIGHDYYRNRSKRAYTHEAIGMCGIAFAYGCFDCVRSLVIHGIPSVGLLSWILLAVAIGACVTAFRASGDHTPLDATGRATLRQRLLIAMTFASIPSCVAMISSLV